MRATGQTYCTKHRNIVDARGTEKRGIDNGAGYAKYFSNVNDTTDRNLVPIATGEEYFVAKRSYRRPN